MIDAIRPVVLPISLGLLGFIEPCSIGASWLFIKTLEGRSPSERVAQVVIFTALRAIVMGGLGLSAVIVGALFFDFQKIAWILFGLVYLIIGLLYLAGKSRLLLFSFGPTLSRVGGAKGSAAIAILFALNIPACAGPLLAILVGTTATAGASGTSGAQGFLSMALFGLGLSAPILAAIFSLAGARWLHWLASMSRAVPRLTGVVLILLGLWSIWFGLIGWVSHR